MDISYIQELYSYNAWANRRVLDACSALSGDQLTQQIGGSFESLRNTLAHIFDVEWLYLERWLGRAPASLPKAESYADIDALRARYESVEQDLEKNIRALSDAELNRIFEFKNTKGTSYRHPLWEMLVHLVNHSTYHRGQVTVLLRAAGAKPIATDMIAFFRERSGQSAV
jgi:uncharacterized damage-inducible protein DinB